MVFILNPYVFATGGATPWTPAQLSNLTAWYDASDSGTVTLSGSNITQVDDKSGNGNHWKQTIVSSQPLYTATINGLNAMAYDGTDYLVTDASFNFSNHTMIVVWQPTTDGANDYIGTNGTTTGHAFSMAYLGKHRAHFWSGSGLRTTDSVASIATNDIIISGQGFSPDNGLKNYLNGVIATAGTGAAVTQTFPLRNGRNTGGRNKNIGEVVFCLEDLSTSDIQKLEGYLAHKWGLTANLPTGHPYKDSPPTV